MQIRYARDESDNVLNTTIEVRAACIVNNSPAVVTSIYSCEDDTGDETAHLEKAFTDYDVILTPPPPGTTNQENDFNFTQAADVEHQNGSSVNVYVYVGEDSNTNNNFYLYYDMAGKLTTTGSTKLVSRTVGTTNNGYHAITGNLTSGKKHHSRRRQRDAR